ncbi:4480_t:CDS:2 [Funneliformis geosporum]|nr:4480_t:CDS:2 [Funneliformis geosporum]
MTSMIHARLSSTLKNIGNHDVIIQVGKNNDVKEFAAHSSVLRACSSYFEKALPTLTAEKNSFFLLLKEPNINPTTFELIHNYIYTDKLDLTELFGYEVLSLLDVSDELNFKRLIHHVQVHLIKQQSDWIQRNIALVIHKAFKIANCKLLQDHCEKFEKDYLYGKKYEFKLLSHSYYRFKSDLFRDLCNIQKDILLLFRDSKTSKIYGGYRPYKSNDGGLSLFKDNCFIFCFENKENTRNMKMIRIFYNHLDDQMNFCYKDVNGKIVKITDFDSVESEVFEVERVVKGLDK